MSVLSDLKEIQDKQAKFIEGLEKKYAAEAVRLQEKLFRKMNETLLSKLATEGGQILNSTDNYTKLYKFNQVWQEYTDNYLLPTVANIANDAMKVTAMSNEYFGAMNAIEDAETFNAAAKNMQMVLGIEKKGGAMSFIENGYMDRLLQGADIRNSVMTVLTDNISVKADISQVTKSLAEVIEGSDEVNGAMERYFGTYVYDTFSGVQRGYDNYLAETAGLSYFQYAGTVMGKTREFCAEKAGLIFSVDDLKEWETQDWAGKNWNVPVEMSLGGYNCRHQLRWLPDDIAKDLLEKQGEKIDVIKADTIRDRDEFEKMVDKYYYTSTNKEQKEAFDEYSSSGYTKIQSWVRHNVDVGGKEYVEKLDEFIEVMPKVEGELYRCSSVSEATFVNIMSQVEKGFYMDKGYGSFSADFDEAQAFFQKRADRRHVKIIVNAKGRNICLTNNRGERECLTKRCTKFSARYEKATFNLRRWEAPDAAVEGIIIYLDEL